MANTQTVALTKHIPHWANEQARFEFANKTLKVGENDAAEWDDHIQESLRIIISVI